ncbi:MAG: ATP-binding cassette domain-containing protein, partial [Egibacteraceae bacterium]
PTAGMVTIGGEDVLAMPPKQLRELRRHQVSMVFQHFGLLPNRRVIDNVGYGLEVQGVSRDARHARAGELLDVVGLTGLGEAYPDELSGGMQQRVGLARALATDPAVLLFDEPFSALDPLIRRDMQDEVIRLQASVRKTMIFITHDLAEALKLGDRIAVMRDGDIVQIGTPEDLVANPADGYVADFTRDVNRSHVLTAQLIMTPVGGAEADGPGGPTMSADTIIHDLIPLVTTDERPVRIVDDHQHVVGTVDRTAVMAAVYGEPIRAAGNGHR